MSLITTQQQSFRLVLHETLLDGLERTGHEVEYQCRSGYCGMCRVKILRGDVEYIEPPLAFVATDEVLPCCCIPVSDIKLDCYLRAGEGIQLPNADLFPMQYGLFADGDSAWDNPSASARANKPARRKRTPRPAYVSTNLALF